MSVASGLTPRRSYSSVSFGAILIYGSRILGMGDSVGTGKLKAVISTLILESSVKSQKSK